MPGPCPECNGYANCNDICTENNELYQIPCITNQETPISGNFFRVTEFFSGGRLLPAIASSSTDHTGWAVVAHKNNQPGPSNFKINRTQPSVKVNVINATVTILPLKLSNDYFVEDNTKTLSYGDMCVFIFKVGIDHYRLTLDDDNLNTQGKLVKLINWPNIPLSISINNIFSVFHIYSAKDKHWESNTDVVMYGQPFFMQVGLKVPLFGYLGLLTTSYMLNKLAGNCTESSSYKKLSTAALNVTTGRIGSVTELPGYFEKHPDLYPQDTGSGNVKVSETFSCENEYSMWFTAQPALEEGKPACAMCGNSGGGGGDGDGECGGGGGGGTPSNGKNWLWIGIGIIAGVIVIVLLIIGFISITKHDDKPDNNVIVIPRQSLPPSNVPQTYPTMVHTAQHGTTPYVVSPQPMPNPELAYVPPPTPTSLPTPSIVPSVPKAPLALNASEVSGGVVL